MLFRKKPAEERSPQELEIALQEAEMPQKGLKPFLHKNGKKLVAVLVIAAILVVDVYKRQPMWTANVPPLPS